MNVPHELYFPVAVRGRLALDIHSRCSLGTLTAIPEDTAHTTSLLSSLINRAFNTRVVQRILSETNETL